MFGNYWLRNVALKKVSEGNIQAHKPPSFDCYSWGISLDQLGRPVRRKHFQLQTMPLMGSNNHRTGTLVKKYSGLLCYCLLTDLELWL